ncbi:hypothetical protein Vau01_039990 [Virgisporangium aurantiacum]|uniref:Uncharacterized protein n=1 Tax=Virgisporangium aurantiacum TaxID=175570 RepID=A0A8J3Z7S8_9ACTN|nr:hypothetical protein Vau01_039990 [Virgisporangium aurantiacum]
MSGLQAVSATLAASTDPVQTVTVTCPSGTELVSAAGSITGALGNATIDDAFPDVARNRVTVTAMVTDPPYATAWRPTAVAYCADDMPGLEWVDARSPYDPRDKAATATCPSNKKLVGTGWSTEDAMGNVLVTGVVPKNGDTTHAADSVTVSAYEESAFVDDAWGVTAFAACATPLTGQRVAVTSTGFDAVDPKLIGVACDPGEVATGGGVSLLAGPAAIGNVVVDDLLPSNLDSGNPPTATNLAAYVEDSPPGDNWTLKVFTLCADG